MENSYAAIEECISEAIKVAQSQKKPNICVLAHGFNVPYSQLYGHFNGQPSWSECPPTNSALDSCQEKALICWIQQLDDLYIPPTPKLVEQQVNKILQHCKAYEVWVPYSALLCILVPEHDEHLLIIAVFLAQW